MPREAISAECDQEFASMVRTLEPYYEPTTLAQDSQGLLRISSASRILFKNNKDGITSEVYRRGDMHHFGSPVVYKNAIYYSDPDVGLIRFDAFSGNEVVIIPNNGENVITEFYFYRDRIFYILGPLSCIEDYDVKCDKMQLMESSLDGSSPRLLAANHDNHRIDGFDPIEQRLYLNSSYGDVGCVSGVDRAYDFAADTIVTLQGYNGCMDDPDFEEQWGSYFKAKEKDLILYGHMFSK
jgi:hypothetical protein